MSGELEEMERTGLEIAVIGMACRFPGANTLDHFWENLKNGVESISHFTDEELLANGISPELLRQPNYVKARGIIENVEYFDAGFFQYSPREAEILDPQIRLLQECCWEALEVAGYDPKRFDGLIGLYAGASTNFKWMQLSPLMTSSSAAEFTEAGTLSYKDAISTFTSYKLGLRGPSLTLYTACSTSLLAVHLASRSLLTGECSIALAGGASISYPKKQGYLYEQGMTSSPNGKVRAFDANAQGAVFSDGVGMVLLKRLEDALADGDTIHAVIRGSAVNNDGARKVGYTAPSVEGQAEVIKAACSIAEVEPESISYLETHGTATNLGDSIEFEAIRRAFAGTEKRAFCGIGSVKSNIGHLDAAAGIAGFIKTVLIAKHKMLPPTLHFERPNPKMQVVDSPFYINTELTTWESNQQPFRAGVSAFGFGGTNVHVILEEPPAPEKTARGSQLHLLILSARSEIALKQATDNLANHLRAHPNLNLADVAYTLQVGRSEFPYRRALICANLHEAVEYLSSEENAPNDCIFVGHADRPLAEDALLDMRQDERAMSRSLPLLQRLASLWVKGASVDWTNYYREERGQRVPLPTYPFEKAAYWLETKRQPGEAGKSTIQKPVDGDTTNKPMRSPVPLLEKKQNIADWFYSPGWEGTHAVQPPTHPNPETWLLFMDQGRIGAALAQRLIAMGQRTILVYAGAPRFSRKDQGQYVLNEGHSEDYIMLLRELRRQGELPQRIVHLWNVDEYPDAATCLNSGFYSLLHLTRAISEQGLVDELEITVLTTGMQNVTGREEIYPEKAMLLAPVKVIPQEHPNILCRSIDLSRDLQDGDNPSHLPNSELMDHLTDELLAGVGDTEVAYRNQKRFVRTYTTLSPGLLEPALTLDENEASPILKQEGVYVITGGLGGIGLRLAEYLARSVNARLALISRSGLPERTYWQNWLAEHGQEDAISTRIHGVQKLEALGARVLVLAADVANELAMKSAIERVEKEFGQINGVIHAAGILRVRSAQCPIATITRKECEEQFQSKVEGLCILDSVLGERNLDFRLLVSSLSPMLGGLGFVAYAAANLFMDAFAERYKAAGLNRWLSVNWGDWQYNGKPFQKLFIGESLERLEMTTQEGIKTFRCVLALTSAHQVVISAGDLHARMQQWINLAPRHAQKHIPTGTPFTSANPPGTLLTSPIMFTTASAPHTRAEMERIILEIWLDFFRVPSVETTRNFFDLGATSLDIIQIHTRLLQRLGSYIPIEIMFTAPTIEQLAIALSEKEEHGATPSSDQTPASFPRELTQIGAGEIAIIGLAGRFPGAKNIEQFWQNLMQGSEAIRFFSDEELLQAGIKAEEFKNPNYVRAKGYLEDADCFDASFFEYTPQDALLMDPQLRLFHECTWTALEHAGYTAETLPGRVGVFAGASPNLYWQVLSTLSEMSEPSSQFLVSLLNDKDSLSTQISYKFNFTGPSINVFTGCSTSLVTIHMACEALRNGHCHAAIAGGITITQPDKAGYLYQEGMLFSADGHCRSFDEQASGMLFGDGVGVVVLKRLEDALAAGDTIHAVIKGSAINNDGNRKIGYTAPSAEGQAAVIQTALQSAGVTPESIGYIETHGTATKLGDSIEIRALRQAFPLHETQVLPIGSVKSNVGHLNAAAGVTGVIKTILCLQQGLIPPSINYTRPNQQIDFEHSPFFVNTQLREWRHDHSPRRAGVSSFGIGGTNAHLILEEAPERAQTTLAVTQPYKLIVLSARTEAALERITHTMATYLSEHHEVNLEDAAYTLQVGRKEFKWRRSFVCETAQQASSLLRDQMAQGVYTHAARKLNPPVVFMFSGNGSQYVNMGRDLYTSAPVFRETLTRCLKFLQARTGTDMEAILYPEPKNMQYAQQALATIEYSQPLIFSFEYALARQLIHWGISPSAMIGYSFGEYVAACLANIFELEDALDLVAVRGQLMNRVPGGAMLSVPLPEDKLRPLLEIFSLAHIEDIPEPLSLAIVNGPSCIVSGSERAIQAFEREMKDKKHLCMRVSIEAAAHSFELDSILTEFETYIKRIELHAPVIPYISNITGTWITDEEATDPLYWVRHLRETVRFSRGIEELKKDEHTIFVEIGPGRNLSALITRFFSSEETTTRILNTIRPQHLEYSDFSFLLGRLARLWSLGVSVNWEAYHEGEQRRRIPLPTYPFEPTSFKISKNPFDLLQTKRADTPALVKNADRAQWYYLPQWSPKMLQPMIEPSDPTQLNWLVFADSCGVADSFVRTLEDSGQTVTIVRSGSIFKRLGEREYAIQPGREEDYMTLFEALQGSDLIAHRIIHFWGITKELDDESDTAMALERSFYSLFSLAKVLGSLQIQGQITLKIITNSVQQVTAEEYLAPAKATALGPALVIPQEYPYIHCSSIDLTLPAAGTRHMQNLVNALVEESIAGDDDKFVAYRGNRRFVLTYAPIQLPEAEHKRMPLRQGGVYLITGGLGGIGLHLARHLVEQVQARLILVTRTGLPERTKWEEWIRAHAPNDRTSHAIRSVQEMEALGGTVLIYTADVADQARLAEVIEHAQRLLGPIHGVIHAAGTIGGRTFNVMRELERTDCEEQFRSKISGLQALTACLADKKLDFCLLMSSIASVLGGIGFAAYAAANLYMDVFAQAQNRESQFPWFSVNWSDWKYWEEGDRDYTIGAIISELSMTPEEGTDAFDRILSWGKAELIANSPGNLQTRIDQWVSLQAQRLDDESTIDTTSFHARPDLGMPYVEPRNPLEQNLARIWQQIFKVQRVGSVDDFLELGGDSLKAITLVSRIHQEFHVEVSLVDLFKLSSIEKLALYIKKAEQVAYEVIEPALLKNSYVLSSAQQRFYILHHLHPGSTAYNDTSVIQLEGELNLQQLEHAFRQMIQRHEAFRTAFVLIDDEPRQVILDHVDFHLHYYQAAEEEVDRIIQNLVQPFDLRVPPLLRVGLITVAEHKHILSIDLHHIITDGVSYDNFVHDLMALYAGQTLPPLRLQYKDYAEWQRSPQEQQVIHEQEAYWLQSFQGTLPVLALPTDFPRPQVQSLSGDTVHFVIERALTEQLKKVVMREETTLYNALLAVYTLLLSKYTGQEDLIIGSPISGRPHADLQEIIGVFVNMLPMRNFPAGHKRFCDFLAEVKETSLAAFAKQKYPYEELVTTLGLQGNLQRNPLFDVLFVLQNMDTERIDTDLLRVRQYEYNHRRAQFDLLLRATEEDGTIQMAMEYPTALFRRTSIEKMTARYLEILDQVVANTTIRLRDITLTQSLQSLEPFIPEPDLADFKF